MSALAEIQHQLEDDKREYATFHSLHEAYAVLEEEVIELRTEIFRKIRNEDAIRKETIQIAAIALRILVDLL